MVKSPTIVTTGLFRFMIGSCIVGFSCNFLTDIPLIDGIACFFAEVTSANLMSPGTMLRKVFFVVVDFVVVHSGLAPFFFQRILMTGLKFVCRCNFLYTDVQSLNLFLFSTSISLH